MKVSKSSRGSGTLGAGGAGVAGGLGSNSGSLSLPFGLRRFQRIGAEE